MPSAQRLQDMKKGLVIRMENKNYTEYDIADVSEEDLKNISELEKSISTNAKEDIVLIAYKHTPNGKTEA